MSQPKWKTVYTTDESRLRVDTTGVYPPELELADEIFDAPAKERFEVFTIQLERQKLVRDDEDPMKFYLVPAKYEKDWPHPVSSYEEWFVKDLPSVAESAGMDIEELVKLLTSDEPKDLAYGYETIAGHWGKHEFDQYPIRLSEKQLNKRFSK
jgi:hypothetical protein